MSIKKLTENDISLIINRLKQVFSIKSEGKIAELLGLGKSALSQQKSRGTLPIDKIVSTCSLKGVNVNYILTGTGPILQVQASANFNGTSEVYADATITSSPPILRRVPLISWVQAGVWAEIVDNFQPSDGEEFISNPYSKGNRTFALRVNGSSMEPRFNDGDIIIVDPDCETNTRDFVIAKINNDEATFKQFIKDGGEMYLRPLNDAFPIIVVPKDKYFRIVGRVMGRYDKC